MQINERPNITSAIETEDGYMVRTLCLVDGFPARIKIEVDYGHRQKYSRFEIDVFDSVRQEWQHAVHTLSQEEVGRMPSLIASAEFAMVTLNRVATLLWEGAELIMRTARLRQEELDLQDHVRRTVATDQARNHTVPFPQAIDVVAGDAALGTGVDV